MNIPKVKFYAMSLEENVDLVKWAFYENNGVLSIHDYTIQNFPELASVDINDSKKNTYKKIEQVVTKDYKKYKYKIDSEAERYNNIWNKYNNKYFEMLSNFFKINFPDIKEIEAKVGLIPIFPRYLDTFSFSVSIDLDESKIVEVVAHETLHFLWFEKWKELYPETPRRHYDSPYIEWKYSEMVTDPILNNEPFNKLFSFTERGYDSFYELYDNDELVMDKLRKIYENNDDIEIKIKKGFDYVSNRIELILNIDRIHTTELGEKRIKNNLLLDNINVMDYIKNKILDKGCNIYKRGKNYYCEVDDIRITINSYNYCIITAHKIKKGDVYEI